MTPTSRDALLAAFADSNQVLRRRALRQLRPHLAEARGRDAVLAALEHDPAWRCRRAAAQALGQCGSDRRTRKSGTRSSLRCSETHEHHPRPTCRSGSVHHRRRVMYRTWPTLVAAAQAVAGDPEELIDAVLNQIANAALAALAIEDPTLLGDPAYEIEDLPDPDLGEQDDRGTKQRYDPLRGFGNFAAAARVCRAYDEQRDDWRARRKPKQTGSLAEQRPFFRQGCAARQNRRIPP